MYTLQPQTKRRNPLITFLAVIGGLALLLFACALIASVGLFGRNGRAISAPSSPVSVIYEIDGCGEFDATYRLPSGTAQKSVKGCLEPIQISRFDGQPGDHVYLSTQNTSGYNSGRAHACVIKADGETIARTESQGRATIASCSARLP